MKLLIAVFALAASSMAQASGHSVSLTCTDTDPIVTGYNFYRGTTTGGPYSQINVGTVTTCAFTDTVVTAGATYYYIAKASDASGTLSAASNQVLAVIPQPPQAPSGLAATVK